MLEDQRRLNDNGTPSLVWVRFGDSQAPPAVRRPLACGSDRSRGQARPIARAFRALPSRRDRRLHVRRRLSGLRGGQHRPLRLPLPAGHRLGWRQPDLSRRDARRLWPWGGDTTGSCRGSRGRARPRRRDLLPRWGSSIAPPGRLRRPPGAWASRRRYLLAGSHFPVPRPARASRLVCLPTSLATHSPGWSRARPDPEPRSHPFSLFAFARHVASSQ